MKLTVFSFLAFVLGDLASAAPRGGSKVGKANVGKLIRRGKSYGLPDPVRRYAFGAPVQRPNPNTVSGGYTPHAMTYSPFNNDDSCKNASDVLADIELMATKNVQSVRIYATECDTLYTVVPALKECDMKLIQGFYMTDAGVDSIDSQVTDFTTWLSADSSNAALVEMLVVGNEAVVNVCPLSAG
jgi:exo-beta-1,3-glucanase (GH17 family)